MRRLNVTLFPYAHGLTMGMTMITLIAQVSVKQNGYDVLSDYCHPAFTIDDISTQYNTASKVIYQVNSTKECQMVFETLYVPYSSVPVL